MPGESESAVATRYDLDLNILIRADRANRLGIADANEASWVPGPHVPVMEEAVDSLASGDRMLVDQGALRQFSLLQQDPEALPDEFTTDDGQTVIQLMALARIGRRFDLKTVARAATDSRWSSWCPGVQAMNLREGRIRARCRIRRNPAHRVFSP